jgi:hypothetical protein
MNDARIAFRALRLYLARREDAANCSVCFVFIAYLSISGITEEEYRSGESERLRRKPVILVKSWL